MRLSLLLCLTMAASVEARPFQWPWSRTAQQTEQKEDRHFRLPWNSRAKEQQRLNAVVQPKPTSREEEIMRPDITKQFNLGSAKFGSGMSVTGKKAATSEFYFENKTRTKSFATSALVTKPAWGSDSKFATKSAETKESWFARLTARTKSYETRESRDANKGLQGRVVPGSDKNFVARGRRQADLDRNGAAGILPGGDRDAGQSWAGDVKPLSIQDVRSLLNKN
jgi:hypothetical protein